jgi:phosphoribosylaminoimidazolecarboxamide formyltransferase/IMP cyclohydrolase
VPPTALLNLLDPREATTLAKILIGAGYVVIASTATARVLRDADLAVVELRAFTGASDWIADDHETLHPRVHAALAADDSREATIALARIGAHRIDLVAVDLPPPPPPGATLVELLRARSVGALALARAAARNPERVVVLATPDDRTRFFSSLEPVTRQQRIGYARRAMLAIARSEVDFAKAAAHFDDEGERREEASSMWVEYASSALGLRGSNAGQRAQLLAAPEPLPGALADALCYGLGDAFLPDVPQAVAAAAAVDLVGHYVTPTAAVFVRRRPVAVASAPTLAEAVEAVLAQRATVDATLAVNVGVDALSCARIATTAIGCVLCPTIDFDGAQDVVRGGRRTLIALREMPERGRDVALYGVPGGLVAERDDVVSVREIEEAAVTSARHPDRAQRELLAFAWIVASRAPSSAAVLARRRGALMETVWIAATEASTQAAIDACLSRAAEFSSETVLALDGEIEDCNVPGRMVDLGVVAVAVPGGAQEVVSPAGLITLRPARTHQRV